MSKNSTPTQRSLPLTTEGCFGMEEAKRWRAHDKSQHAPSAPGATGPVDPILVSAEAVAELSTSMGIVAFDACVMLIVGRLGTIATCHLVPNLRVQCGPGRSVAYPWELAVPTVELLDERLRYLELRGFLTLRACRSIYENQWSVAARLQAAVKAALDAHPYAPPPTISVGARLRALHARAAGRSHGDAS